MVKLDDIIREVAKELHIPQKQVREVATSVFNSMYVHLCETEDVSIPHFGKFEVVKRGPRTCRNPKTGEEIEVPTRHGVKYRPTVTLRDNLANITE